MISFPRLEALSGLSICILGVLREDDVLRLAGFIQISAACICYTVERHSKEGQGDAD